MKKSNLNKMKKEYKALLKKATALRKELDLIELRMWVLSYTIEMANLGVK